MDANYTITGSNKKSHYLLIHEIKGNKAICLETLTSGTITVIENGELEYPKGNYFFSIINNKIKFMDEFNKLTQSELKEIVKFLKLDGITTAEEEQEEARKREDKLEELIKCANTDGLNVLEVKKIKMRIRSLKKDILL